jgi:hypothetical protein
MKELIGLVATLIEASGATERRRSAAAAMMVVAAGFIIGLGALGVLICLLAAVWLYELPALGDVGAPLVVAAVLAGVTGIAGLILHHKTQAAPPPPPSPAINPAAIANVANSVMKSNKFLVLIGALMIGLAVGENSGNNIRR